MSTELLAQIVAQMYRLCPQDLHHIEKHAATLRRTHPVQIGKTYEVSEFPVGELKLRVVLQIRILKKGISLLWAKDICDSGSLTCLVDDDEMRRALQALTEMGCLVVETKL